jgi:hypothetical protein
VTVQPTEVHEAVRGIGERRDDNAAAALLYSHLAHGGSLCAPGPDLERGRNLAAVCVQCMMGAATTVGAASGIRAWLGQHFGTVLTPQRLRLITIALFSIAVLASGLFVTGSSAAPH